MVETGAKKTTLKVKKISERHLYNVAVYYLERYASSTEQLRQVLKRRVMKATRLREDTDPDAYEWIENVIQKLTEQGFLNDAHFTESRVRSLSERGKSTRAITTALQQKRVASHLIKNEIQKLKEDNPNLDADAAKRFVKRKKLGSFRPKDQRQENYKKDLATLARNGFSYDIAVQVLGPASADEDDDLEAIFSASEV